jgi:hypothetical protein
MSTEISERYFHRHIRKECRRLRREGKHRCEVIMCGKNGPHRCPQVPGFLIDGHAVCQFHFRIAPHVAVFTAEEAIALHRARRVVPEYDPREQETTRCGHRATSTPGGET